MTRMTSTRAHEQRGLAAGGGHALAAGGGQALAAGGSHALAAECGGCGSRLS